ncbi:MAG: response regulator transcription factor [Acidobacteriaceae bacterium]|nr:response regulator transcription factor [Acidobacteriaceae bacterium]
MDREMKSIRVLVVDDHPLLREGIAALLGSTPDLELVGEAATGEEALTLYRRFRPDVTLMDLQLPGISGLDTIAQIRADFPQAKIIVLTTYSGDVQLVRALKVGVRAYLLKGKVRRELVDTIRAVFAGQKRIDPEVATKLAHHTPDDALSSREIEILSLIASGHGNKQIAGRLAISEETVKSHVSRILEKLGAHDRTHAVTIGVKRGIIEL